MPRINVTFERKTTLGYDYYVAETQLKRLQNGEPLETVAPKLYDRIMFDAANIAQSEIYNSLAITDDDGNTIQNQELPSG